MEGQAAALGRAERGLLEAEMEITSGPCRTGDRRGFATTEGPPSALHLAKGSARGQTEGVKEAPCLASPSALSSAGEVRGNAGELGDKANKGAARWGPLGAKIKDAGSAAERPLD